MDLPKRTKMPPAVLWGLCLAIALDTLVQMVWKSAVVGIPETASLSLTLICVSHNPYIYFAMVGFVAQFYNWMRVLSRADLSFAQPVTALSGVSVMAVSHYAFHETITFNKAVGMLLILMGVYCISQTAYQTRTLDR